MIGKMIKFLVKVAFRVVLVLVVVFVLLKVVNHFFDTPIDVNLDNVVSNVTDFVEDVGLKDAVSGVTDFVDDVDFKGAVSGVKDFVGNIDFKGFTSVVTDYVGSVDLSSLTDDELFDYFLSHYEEFVDKGSSLLENFWSDDTVYWDEGQGEIVYESSAETSSSKEEVPVAVTGGASDLLAVSNTYLGVPYKYGGTGRRGIDCSGFVGAVHQEALGLSLPRTAHDIYKKANSVDNSALAPGNLVFFSASGRRISHVGIYMGGGKFIHAASAGPKTGVIISKLSERYWSRTYVGGGTVF